MQITKEIMDKNEKGDSDFLKIEMGSENRFRIVSPIHGVKEHSLEFADGSYKFPVCPREQAIWEAETKGEQLDAVPRCPICERGVNDGTDNGVKTKYLAIAFNRKDGKLGILKSGKMIFSQLITLNEDDEWGNLTNYDFKVNRTGEKLSTKYEVIGVPTKTALTEEDTAKLEKSELDVEKMTIPNDYNKLCEIARLDPKEGGDDASQAF